MVRAETLAVGPFRRNKFWPKYNQNNNGILEILDDLTLNDTTVQHLCSQNSEGQNSSSSQETPSSPQVPEECKKAEIQSSNVFNSSIPF